MDIKQLRYFIALAEERQVTAAAQRLHMSQPPLSQQLQAMENELGVLLFERKGRRLELTAAGQMLYGHALSITRLLEKAKVEVQESASGVRGKLSIGINTLSNEQLCDVLSSFSNSYPDVTFKIQQNETKTLIQLVKDKIIDLAIVRLPISLDDFEYKMLADEPLYFVTGKSSSDDTENHRASVRPAISYDRIAEQPLILPSIEGFGLYQMIVEQFYARGLSPRIVGECSDIGLLIDLISKGFGASILPITTLHRYRGERIATYSIEGVRDTSSSALIWLKHSYISKAARQFIQLFPSDSTLANHDPIRND